MMCVASFLEDSFFWGVYGVPYIMTHPYGTQSTSTGISLLGCVCMLRFANYGHALEFLGQKLDRVLKK